jgi:flagellar assembly protein FliH
MARTCTLVAFDRRLSGAVIPGRASRQYGETEVQAIRVAAYQEGSDAARAFADQQVVEFRAEVQALQSGIFARLADAESLVASQLAASLPGLVEEIARRLLAGFEPPPETVRLICNETLAQLYPEIDNLELIVSARDAAVLEKTAPEWRERYPGLRVTASAALAPGDCQVRSRFGLTDARLSSKAHALAQDLSFG